jgi:tetratricopeptide (TPR) repeat protein
VPNLDAYWQYLQEARWLASVKNEDTTAVRIALNALYAHQAIPVLQMMKSVVASRPDELTSGNHVGADQRLVDGWPRHVLRTTKMTWTLDGGAITARVDVDHTHDESRPSAIMNPAHVTFRVADTELSLRSRPIAPLHSEGASPDSHESMLSELALQVRRRIEAHTPEPRIEDLLEEPTIPYPLMTAPEGISASRGRTRPLLPPFQISLPETEEFEKERHRALTSLHRTAVHTPAQVNPLYPAELVFRAIESAARALADPELAETAFVMRDHVIAERAQINERQRELNRLNAHTLEKRGSTDTAGYVAAAQLLADLSDEHHGRFTSAAIGARKLLGEAFEANGQHLESGSTFQECLHRIRRRNDTTGSKYGEPQFLNNDIERAARSFRRGGNPAAAWAMLHESPTEGPHFKTGQWSAECALTLIALGRWEEASDAGKKVIDNARCDVNASGPHRNREGATVYSEFFKAYVDAGRLDEARRIGFDLLAQISGRTEKPSPSIPESPTPGAIAKDMISYLNSEETLPLRMELQDSYDAIMRMGSTTISL